MAIPLGPRPASSVAITAGGLALRSMTESRLSGTCFFGSAGSSFWVAATSAKDSSGATATFCGGPVTLDGAFSSAMILGGETPRLIMVTVSSTGGGGTETVPLLRTTLPSVEDTAICAATLIADSGKAAMVNATTTACVREIRSFMIIPPGLVFPRFPKRWFPAIGGYKTRLYREGFGAMSFDGRALSQGMSA